MGAPPRQDPRWAFFNSSTEQDTASPPDRRRLGQDLLDREGCDSLLKEWRVLGRKQHRSSGLARTLFVQEEQMSWEARLAALETPRVRVSRSQQASGSDRFEDVPDSHKHSGVAPRSSEPSRGDCEPEQSHTEKHCARTSTTGVAERLAVRLRGMVAAESSWWPTGLSCPPGA